MDLTGKVIAIMEARGGVSQRTGNSWMTQEYVIEIPGQFPRKMMFNVFGEERIKQFNIQPGEEITVRYAGTGILRLSYCMSVAGVICLVLMLLWNKTGSIIISLCGLNRTKTRTSRRNAIVTS